MKKDYTHITIVLDRSGSMTSRVADTVGGFNKFIEEQKRCAGTATLSLVQFDNVIEQIFNGDLKLFGTLEFKPRGSTSLLDAIGFAIEETGKWLRAKHEWDRPERVLFIVLTDGEENSSQKFTRDQIFDQIKHQEDQYKWNFVFMGADRNTIKDAAKIGFSYANTLNYNENNVSLTYGTLTNKVNAFRSADIADPEAVRGSLNFTLEERENNKPI